ncbi:MAG: HAD family hydrolase [Silicimonas sp.]|jgi:phosphoglycolate phosphatase|nr:HAD family hydrolase [Silicimonas sp.]
MSIEAILFDKDGTLFDFQATWSLAYLDFLAEVAPGALFGPACEAAGYDREAQRFRPDSVVIASTSVEVAAILSPVLNRDPGEIVEVMHRIGGATRQVPAVPLGPCLSALRADYRLGLVTNDSEVPARRHLEEAGVIALFEFVAGYDSGFGAKPGPGQLLAFSEKAGIAPDAVVMVGDSRHDLSAARAAGMVPVGVLTGAAGAADLADLAEVVLPDIGHLADWLDRR